MKKYTLFLLAYFVILGTYAQDTISTNIYQKNRKLGIGISEPNTWLTVINDSSSLEYNSNTSIADFRRIYNNSTTRFQIYGYPKSDVQLPHVKGSVMLYATGDADDLILCATNNSGQIRFFTGTWSEPSSERMRIMADGKIGIKTTNPIELLDINGGLKIGNTTNTNAGTIRWNGSDFEGYDGVEWLSLTTQYSEFQHNNIYFSNNRLGIGNEVPEYLLDIKSDEGNYTSHPRQFIHLHNTNNSMHSNVAIAMKSGTGDNQAEASFGLTALSYTANPGLSGFAYIYNTNSGIVLRANSSQGIIRMLTGGDAIENERMRIDTSGNIGIGTAHPAAKLQIADGDIYISDIEKGIIMKSPDGGCWRGTLDNSGNLNFMSIDCPDAEDLMEIPQTDSGNNSLSIFPNPAENTVTINNTLYSEKLILKIYTADGKLIERAPITIDNFTKDISGFKAGTYIFRIEDRKGNLKAAEKIVKN